MNFKELISNYSENITGLKLNSISLNSQEITNRDLYISLAKNVANQKNYNQEAFKRGASLILTNLKSLEDRDKKIIFIDNLDENLGTLSNKFYKNPSKKLKVYGITGTNGKSSVSYYLFQLLNQIEKKNGLISNLNLNKAGIYFSRLTTPDIFTLNKILSSFVSDKKKAAIFEVSSHGIKQKRISGIEFDYGCLTSFSRDHLDYHSSISEYGKVKESFFLDNKFKGAVINIDSKIGQKIFSIKKDFISISRKNKKSDIYIEGKKGLFFIHSPWGNIQFPERIFADHIMMNIASAFGLFCISSKKIDLKRLNLKNIIDLPGRFQKIHFKSNKCIYIDYAHTPAALENILLSLKNKYKGNLICLFGCGGDRDQGKRPLMGAVANSLADKIILTNDNPRLENPKKIIEEILEGIKDLSKANVIEDRTKAIKFGLKILSQEKEESVLLLAGKGHESNQEFKRKTIESNDYEIVRSFI